MLTPSIDDVLNERDGWRRIGSGIFVKAIDMTLEERRKANVGQQIDNSSLPAGANMYYYCRCCGAQTAVLPEGWYRERPPKYCEECKKLPEEQRTSYDTWLTEHGHARVPS